MNCFASSTFLALCRLTRSFQSFVTTPLLGVNRKFWKYICSSDPSPKYLRVADLARESHASLALPAANASWISVSSSRACAVRCIFQMGANGGNLPQAGNTKIRMSPKLQNTTNFPPKHVQPGLRQIAVMAGSPSKSHSGHLLPRTFCLSLAVWWCKIFLTCILKAFPEY